VTQTENLAINIEQLRFRWPNQQQDVLNIDAFTVPRGEHLFIQGASGSGKSTLLNLMAGVLTPQSGHIELLGQDICTLSNRQRDRFRADHLGIIFQQFNLLPYLNAMENIQLSLEVSRKPAIHKSPSYNQHAAILTMLKQLGLDENVAKQPASQLSIGQQQRVAVARALINQPEILIADEPTSALDSDTRDRFIEQLFKVAEESNTTIVFVSHDQNLSAHFSRHLHLSELNHASKGVQA